MVNREDKVHMSENTWLMTTTGGYVRSDQIVAIECVRVIHKWVIKALLVNGERITLAGEYSSQEKATEEIVRTLRFMTGETED